MPMTFKGEGQWSDAEAAEAMTVAAAVDIDAARPSWRRRLFLRSDGAWHLEVRTPRPGPDHQQSRYAPPDQPWTWPWDWRAYESKLLPFAEGIALLRSPKSPELEMERRQQLVARYDAGVAAERAKAEQRKQDEEAATAARRARERELRIEQWDQLTPTGRTLYRLFVAIRGLAAEVRERDEQLADTLTALAEVHRAIAAEELIHGKQRPGAVLGPAMPAECWWE